MRTLLALTLALVLAGCGAPREVDEPDPDCAAHLTIENRHAYATARIWLADANGGYDFLGYVEDGHAVTFDIPAGETVVRWTYRWTADILPEGAETIDLDVGEEHDVRIP